MSSTGSATVTGAPAVTEAPPPPRSRWPKHTATVAFLGPAVFFLSLWIIYPTVRTFIRSLYNDAGDRFIWFQNYQELFQDDRVITAIKNNAIWIAVVPAGVTALGLVFAVLTERIRWSVAFKFAVFMPLAVSLFAVGVIWRIMYQKDPERGAVNAGISAIRGIYAETGVLSRANPSTETLRGSPRGGLELTESIGPGDVALLGLTAISSADVPEDAVQAVQPEVQQGGITGVVWRDFKPGGGNPGEVEQEEVGLPGVTVELRDADGGTINSTKTGADGTFAFEGIEQGEYRVAIGPATFARPFGGVNWLGEKLITPSIIIAFLWVQAGFAMVITAAGLSAIPRDVLEAARTDGGSEWQVFRRVTVPLLAPILTVVFVTQMIGVLKVFDIVVAIAPGSSRDDASVIALEMWQRAFSGQNRFGFGAAISMFMFVLFIPFLVANIRRFRRERI